MTEFLPVFFVFAMGLALLVYVVLDGFDLGIGILLPLASEPHKDVMISSIGPFWDANETWIVLGVGILLIAFPQAHGIVLTALYTPVTIMLFGLILRGVAFDFRVKAGDDRRGLWNNAFFAGSLVASMAQGWMLGAYITGLQDNTTSLAFAALIAVTLPALYVMLGAAWLMIKTEHALFEHAMRWGKNAWLPMGAGLLLVSVATPLVSSEIAARWFTLPNAIGLVPIPVTCAAAYLGIGWLLRRPDVLRAGYAKAVFIGLVLICLMAAFGLAYSLYPDIILGRMTLFEAAAHSSSLQFIFWGVAVTLPLIAAYSIYVYRVFGGKTTALSYE
ncbi:MAG: cytochrome d ubiquinol oxidase subunit II [Gammaproteobacteria bacterium]|nr:cytochrome d ubiquinol oxidase subunit II [Gammaproteobacteria bacterium]